MAKSQRALLSSARRSQEGGRKRRSVISQVQSPSGTTCSLIAKLTVVTRRCFDRTSDSSSIFRSVFRLISAIAVSTALWRKFAQTAKGAFWMIFPSASFTDSSPSTFRSCSKEVRFVPPVTFLFAQPSSRRAYWLRSPTIGWLLIAAASSKHVFGRL